ncbi:Bug family tripartite tricarboxylate transporter substrate binding protein [Ramlibacter sp.]|uniref:Bug family tripartite tricarboxylate transporter substrate binding protein n=1 Tax=Ramlibacter sp. TaxID=1917967 RepID=UPI003D134055
MITRRSLLASSALATLPAGFAFADEYPSKTIRILVSTGAGTATDATARYAASQLTKMWNQPVVVENVTGAGGVIATTQVFRAPADGYTLLFTYASHYSNQWTTKTPYDAVNDFEPVARMASTALVLAVKPDSPFKTARDVIAAAKKAPGTLTYGTAGPGTTGHMAGALFASIAGIELKHVPYKTPGAAAVDAASGVLDMCFNGPASVMPLVQGGRLRIVAQTGTKRMSSMPDVPTMVEAGLPGYENSSPVWMFAVKGTPQPILAKLSDALVRIGNTPEFRDAVAKAGLEVDVAGMAQSKAAGPAELEKWKRMTALTASKD